MNIRLEIENEIFYRLHLGIQNEKESDINWRIQLWVVLDFIRA